MDSVSFACLSTGHPSAFADGQASLRPLLELGAAVAGSPAPRRLGGGQVPEPRILILSNRDPEEAVDELRHSRSGWGAVGSGSVARTAARWSPRACSRPSPRPGRARGAPACARPSEVLAAIGDHRPDVIFNLCEALDGDSRHEVMCAWLLAGSISLHRQRSRRAPELPAQGRGELDPRAPACACRRRCGSKARIASRRSRSRSSSSRSARTARWGSIGARSSTIAGRSATRSPRSSRSAASRWWCSVMHGREISVSLLAADAARAAARRGHLPGPARGAPARDHVRVEAAPGDRRVDRDALLCGGAAAARSAPGRRRGPPRVRGARAARLRPRRRAARRARHAVRHRRQPELRSLAGRRLRAGGGAAPACRTPTSSGRSSARRSPAARATASCSARAAARRRAAAPRRAPLPAAPSPPRPRRRDHPARPPRGRSAAHRGAARVGPGVHRRRARGGAGARRRDARPALDGRLWLPVRAELPGRPGRRRGAAAPRVPLLRPHADDAVHVRPVLDRDLARFRPVGVARGLVSTMESEIAREGGGLVRVETGSREGHGAAVRFYDAVQFTRAAVLADFYAPGDDLIIYTRGRPGAPRRRPRPARRPRAASRRTAGTRAARRPRAAIRGRRASLRSTTRRSATATTPRSATSCSRARAASAAARCSASSRGPAGPRGTWRRSRRSASAAPARTARRR